MNNELKDRIKSSGNNLHLDIARQLSSAGWAVDVSSYYVDDISTIPREIDIVAHKLVQVRYQPQPYLGDVDHFDVFLLIECKYFKKDIAFRILDNNKDESSEAITAINMSKEKLLSPDYRAFDEHHYFKPKIAKLHDAINSDDQKGVFNAISQSVKSLIYHSIAYGKKSLYYPISVYKGIDGIYGVEDRSVNLDEVIQEKHLIYGINYAYRSLRDSRLNKKMYYVDFVHENKLPDYLDLIDDELDKLSQSLGSLFIMNLQNKG